MSSFPVIVIGASAGGVEALKRFVSLLPPNLDAAIFVVLHVSARGTSVLPDILSRNGSWRAVHAVDGMEIVRGTIYVAPPDRHLLLHRDRVAVVKGPKENGHRPSVDSLFRSAAQHFGPMATGIILSGSLDDGTAGLMAIKRKGGTAIAQDPADALFSGMPNSAIQSVDVDHVLPVDEIPALLSRRMARNAHLKRHQSTAARFDAEAVLSEEQAVRLRTLLLSRDSGAVDSEPRFESRNPPSTPRNGGSGGREESSSLPNPD